MKINTATELYKQSRWLTFNCILSWCFKSQVQRSIPVHTAIFSHSAFKIQNLN